MESLSEGPRKSFNFFSDLKDPLEKCLACCLFYVNKEAHLKVN